MRNFRFLLRRFRFLEIFWRGFRSVKVLPPAAFFRFLPHYFRFPKILPSHFRFPKFLLASIFLFSLAPIMRAQSALLPENDSERQLFEALNRERAAHSLPVLQWDDALFKAARLHALRMINLNQLEHQLPNEPNLEERLAAAGARFSVIAENIAFGPNPNTIHSGWMNSPGHRKNILDARLNSVGIAVVRGTGGLFAVQDFSHSIVNLSVEQQEQAITALLVARGFQIAGAAEDARKSCESHKPIADSKVRSMMWFETTDLTALPEDVARKVESMPSRKMTVGACNAKNEAGFAHFRIAILLF
jgi:uncharacterized protein YkwD